MNPISITITSNGGGVRWHRGAFVATLLLLLSHPHCSWGQEAATATAADEAATTADVDAADVPMGDVTDLGDVVGDSMADLTEMVEDLDSESASASSEEVVADVDGTGGDAADASPEEPTATATDTEGEETVGAEAASADTDSGSEAEGADAASAAASETPAEKAEPAAPVVQSGPFIDLLGDTLLSLEMVDDTHAQVHQHYTNEALDGKKVVGLYFSADWCGPCRQFTPDLVNFYQKMNARRGKQDEFEIVWISRCRTVDDFGQYFTQMNWLALPPNEAMGQRGQYLGEKFKVKSIPTLVLLDEIGNVITTDARNKIPMDKAGIGFPWRSPMSVLISTLVPRSFRLLVKSQFSGVLKLVKGVLLKGGGQR